MRPSPACALAAVLLSGTALAQPGRYISEEVPTYDTTFGNGLRYAQALNDTGVVALSQPRLQFVTQNPPMVHYVTGGFAWSPGSLVPLTPLDELRNSYAYDINNSGLIVGFACSQAIPSGQAAVLSPSSPPELIPTFGMQSIALAVNDHGTIVGYYVSATNPVVLRAFAHTAPGPSTDLGTLGGAASVARDVNAAGTIVGQSQDADGVLRAFILPAGGTMTDLNTLLPDAPQHLQDVVKISPDGRVAVITPGSCYTVLPSDPLSIVELRASPPDGKLYYPAVMGLNSSGLAVGYQTRGSGLGATYIATKWDPEGNPTALYDRTVNRPPSPFQRAVDINASGQILVFAGAAGLNLIYRLTPLCPADVNADGYVDGIDYDQFMYAFETGASSADFNQDGFVDGIDCDQFTIGFELGC